MSSARRGRRRRASPAPTRSVPAFAVASAARRRGASARSARWRASGAGARGCCPGTASRPRTSWFACRGGSACVRAGRVVVAGVDRRWRPAPGLEPQAGTLAISTRIEYRMPPPWSARSSTLRRPRCPTACCRPPSGWPSARWRRAGRYERGGTAATEDGLVRHGAPSFRRGRPWKRAPSTTASARHSEQACFMSRAARARPARSARAGPRRLRPPAHGKSLSGLRLRQDTAMRASQPGCASRCGKRAPALQPARARPHAASGPGWSAAEETREVACESDWPSRGWPREHSTLSRTGSPSSRPRRPRASSPRIDRRLARRR